MKVDKVVIQQVLGILMKRPHLLGEVDKYSLTILDFSTRFERYIFTAINGLYQQGVGMIAPLDVANYLDLDTAAKDSFVKNNGIEYLQDIIEFSNESNFDYYYNKLKKLNLLRDLNKQGFDINEFYNEDTTDISAIEINSRFEKLTTKDICDKIKMKILSLEADYAKTGEVETVIASDGMREFLSTMNDTIELGVSVQGAIYNKIIGGAQLQALTIRSGASGLGKTRNAVADACYLAYPIRYNSTTRQWEQKGSSEKVLFIITEQTFPQIKKMILAYISDINESRFKFGNFSEEELRILNTAVDIMERFADNMILIKMPNPTIELVKTTIRSNCLMKQIHYVFFDYIFINPGLLGEFKGFNLRNDELLLLLATALKDLAVELNVAMFTATQVNAAADDNKHIRNEASLAGGRSTINKADNGAIMARPTPEELETLEPLISKYGCPNCVTDIFKCRSGEWTQVRIWSQIDLGRMKKRDLFITDARLDAIADFYDDNNYEVHNWTKDEVAEYNEIVANLNERV